jgi:NAD(P)H dehydrogenase (quinone)
MPRERTVMEMRVLTVYAHPNPKSFCHAVLDQFTAGLADAGHVCEVVDLHAIKFDPIFSLDDYAFFAHETVPPELLDETELRENMIAASGGPIRRYLAKRWLRDKDLPELLQIVAKRQPKDVLAQQEKVAAADGLAFVAPIIWMNFPAVLRGWIERVFSYGFVYTMSREGWLEGQLSGRQPLLRHKKAVIMTPTFFRESDYRESGCGAAIERLVDDFGFRYPGIEQVEHVYFYAVNAVDDAARREYLQQAYRLGHEFESSLVSAVEQVEEQEPEMVEGGVR